MSSFEQTTNASPPAASTQLYDVSGIVAGLLRDALAGQDLRQLFDRVCTQLQAAGVGLSRAHLTINTLHPQFRALSHTWYLQQDLKTEYYSHGEDGDAWLQSPFRYMIANQVMEMRRRLTGDDAIFDFPILELFAEQGLTDYRAYLAAFAPLDEMQDRPEGMAGSWCTSQASGFTAARITALREIELALAVVSKMHLQQQMTENILQAYLGADAGRQVRRGRIRRGDVEAVHAVIWYSDMRDSTEMAATLDGRDFLSDINEYFDCTAGAILEQGGEVLRFIGDAVLAIFPVRADRTRETAVSQAEAAMLDARRRMHVINRQRAAAGRRELRYGLALHYGEVLFGNIGSEQRLEFSVVGAAANEAARLEEMTKSLGYNSLVSDRVAKHMSLQLAALGHQHVRGSDECLQVYAVLNESEVC